MDEPIGQITRSRVSEYVVNSDKIYSIWYQAAHRELKATLRHVNWGVAENSYKFSLPLPNLTS